MRKLAAVAASVVFSGAAMIAPALATTSETTSGPGYVKSAVDCLVLLFTNPKARTEQCGTPNSLPPPPGGSLGFKTCGVAEINPFGIDGTKYQVAGSGPVYCCGGYGSLDWKDGLPQNSLIWNIEASQVVLAAC